MSGCLACGSERIKITPGGRTYCIPCRRAHEKRRKSTTAPVVTPSAEDGQP